MKPRPITNTRCCRVCGCRDDIGCPGGCFWIEVDLCSQCQYIENTEHLAPKLLDHARVFDYSARWLEGNYEGRYSEVVELFDARAADLRARAAAATRAVAS